MPSARRQRLISKRLNKGKNVSFAFLKFLIPIFLVAVVWIFIVFDTKYWNGTDKFAYVFRGPDGNVDITVLDPKLTESTTLVIPGDTQVDVAGNYGTLRIKNVLQLGLNEKLGGSLLASTVTKNFLMPVFLWSGDDINTFKFIFAPKSNNIPLGDRIRMTLFSMQVKNVNTSTIDLGKSQYLKKAVLTDGQVGYILSGPVSTRLTAIFSDNSFADKSLRVGIIDATGSPGSANTVGQIVEVLGGKVVSVDRKDTSPGMDCFVLGSDSKIVKKIAALFGCKTSDEKSVFDVEIQLGALFAKRY